MREATQRRYVRCVFLLLCVTPIVGVLGWSVVWALPSHVTRIENRMREQLGVLVRIEEIQHPLPNEQVYVGIRLEDPETETLLGQLTQLRVRSGSQVLELDIDELTIISGQRERLWNCLHDRFVKGSSVDEIRYRILQMNVDPDHPPLYNVTGRVWSVDSVSQATASFQFADGSEQPRFEVEVSRDRRTVPLETQLSFDTQQHPISVGIAFPRLATKLGRNVTADGSLDVIWQSNAWRAEFQGRLENVSLGSMPLSAIGASKGLGSIQADKLVFTGDRLIGASTSVSFSDGFIDPTLIKRMVADQLIQVRQSVPATSASAPSDSSFEQLALTFDLENEVVEVNKDQSGPVLIHTRGATFELRRSLYLAQYLRAISARQ